MLYHQFEIKNLEYIKFFVCYNEYFNNENKWFFKVFSVINKKNSVNEDLIAIIIWLHLIWKIKRNDERNKERKRKDSIPLFGYNKELWIQTNYLIII